MNFIQITIKATFVQSCKYLEVYKLFTHVLSEIIVGPLSPLIDV